MRKFSQFSIKSQSTLSVVEMKLTVLNLFVLFVSFHYSNSMAVDNVDTSDCYKVLEVKDHNGKLLKSVCNIQESQNYEGAVEFCEQRGMDLLVIDNDYDYKEVARFVAEIYASLSPYWANTAYALWINGKKNEDGKWMVKVNNEEKEIPTKLKVIESGVGNCLVLKRDYDEIEATVSNGWIRNHFMCQFTPLSKDEEVQPVKGDASLLSSSMAMILLWSIVNFILL